MLDNVTVGWGSSKRHSKQALNSIHKSCKLQKSAKLYFPPDEHVLYKDNFAWEWQAIESHCWHCTTCWKCVFYVSWTLNISAWDANCLFAINAQIAICASREINSSVMVSFSFALRIRPSTNINVDLDSLKVSLNHFSL